MNSAVAVPGRTTDLTDTPKADVSIAHWLHRHFVRVTSGGRFLPCVDGLRFIAILSVVLYHLNHYVVARASGFSELDARSCVLFHWLNGANCGVQVFFAISGFILALPFARERQSGSQRVSLKHYYLRRLTRLEPPFVVNLLLVFVLLVVVKKESVQSLIAPLLATMTYTHDWIYGELSRINGVTWSLEIEVQFYLLAPLIARFLFGLSPSRRRTLLGVAIIAMIVSKMVVPVDGSLRLRLGLLYVLDHFLAGILVADVFVNDWKESPRRCGAWDLVTLLTLPALFAIQRSDVLLHLLPIFSFAALVSAFRGRVSNRILSWWPLVLIGGMCYSIYLYHFFVISLIGRLTMPLAAGHSYAVQILLQAVVIIPITLAVCAVFFVAVERPFMQWRPLRLKKVSGTNSAQHPPGHSAIGS